MYIYIYTYIYIIYIYINIYLIYLSIYINKYIQKLFDEIKMLQVNFIIICIIHKISVLLEITRILKTFFNECNRIFFFLNVITTYNDGKLRS